MNPKTSISLYNAFQAFVNKYVPQILEDKNSFSLAQLNSQLIEFNILHTGYIDQLDELQLQQMRLDLIFCTMP
ncbi:MAG: hypothetical protein IPJ81_05415 [Chitinophagaceae bacterium]|nr:hypothetical protein [Chitinophagaceae bacterium]